MKFQFFFNPFGDNVTTILLSWFTAIANFCRYILFEALSLLCTTSTKTTFKIHKNILVEAFEASSCYVYVVIDQIENFWEVEKNKEHLLNEYQISCLTLFV